MSDGGYVKDAKAICFVVTPIGSEGSETRLRADKVLRHIIEPVVEEFDYEPIRADQISNPGIITHQVIQQLLNAPLVVADLTGGNPNVFYELGIRHMTRKPVVSIVEVGERIPFDVSQSRAILVDHRDLDSVSNCKDELRHQIQSLQETPEDFFNPVSVTVDVAALYESGDHENRGLAAIFSMLEGMNSEIGRIRSEVMRDTTVRHREAASIRPIGEQATISNLGAAFSNAFRDQEGEIFDLSARERDILTRVVQGKTDSQIAKELFISKSTVKRHLLSIYRTLGVENRTEATQRLLGGVDPNDSSDEPDTK